MEDDQAVEVAAAELRAAEERFAVAAHEWIWQHTLDTFPEARHLIVRFEYGSGFDGPTVRASPESVYGTGGELVDDPDRLVRLGDRVRTWLSAYVRAEGPAEDRIVLGPPDMPERWWNTDPEQLEPPT